MTKINIILLGERGVGKSTLLFRFKNGEFKESDKSTIGADFQIKKLILEGNEVTLFIWDTSGEERHRAIVRSYYRQGEGVLLVYDVTNLETFYKLSSWLCELRNVNENAEVLIDSSKKTVAISVVKNFAKEEKLEYMEMSAMSGKNVEEAFIRLAKKILIAKGILAEKPDKSRANSGNDFSKRTTQKNNVPDKDNDIIRLEITPMTTASDANKCFC